MMARHAGMAFGQQTNMQADPVEVFQKEAREAAMAHPEPAYTPMAKQLKLHGPVIVSAFVNKEGTVMATAVQPGNPLLVARVEEAVKQRRKVNRGEA